MSDMSDQEKAKSKKKEEEPEEKEGEEFQIFPRDLWDPMPSPRPMDRMIYPVKAVFWTETQSKPCYNKKQCLRRIREIQEFHIKGGMFDIPFNFLVGGDCRVYEGRGWDWGCLLPYTRKMIIDMQRHPFQNKSLVIAYIGKTVERDLDHPMVKAGDKLIEYAKSKNLIEPNFETFVQPCWITYAKNVWAVEPKPEFPG